MKWSCLAKVILNIIVAGFSGLAANWMSRLSNSSLIYGWTCGPRYIFLNKLNELWVNTGGAFGEGDMCECECTMCGCKCKH